MPQFGNVVLKDGAGASHTFTPRDITNGVATLVEPTNGAPVADKRLSYASTRSTSGRVKRSIKLQVPVAVDTTVNGTNTKPSVVRVAYVDLTFNFDQTSTTAERQDAMAYIAELLKGTTGMTKEFIVDLGGIY